MRHTRACALALLTVITLTACGATATDGATGTTTTGRPPPRLPSPTPVFATYQVPDSACPENYGIGLSITTDKAAEIDYVDDVIACVNRAGTATYLKNTGDAVWTLAGSGARSGTMTGWRQSVETVSFRQIVGQGRPVMTPKAEVTVDLPPSDLRWDLDLRLSIQWQGHHVVAEKIKSAGTAAFYAAMTRRSPARTALLTCTLGVDEAASAVRDLPDADLTQVMLTGLGAVGTVNKCRQAAKLVQVSDDAGRAALLSDELARLQRQATLIDDASKQLGHVARAAKLINFLKFVVP